MFADLTGFTTLTETLGDEAGAAIALRLAHLATEIAERHEGQIVKLLGDGVLLRFSDADRTVAASLELVARARPEGPSAGARGGERGRTIHDEGDYFGRTVNLATRIASTAGLGQACVSTQVVASVDEGHYRFVELGAMDLKGAAAPVRSSKRSKRAERERAALALRRPRGCASPITVRAFPKARTLVPDRQHHRATGGQGGRCR